MPVDPPEITLEAPSYGKDGIRLIVSGPAPPGAETDGAGAGSSAQSAGSSAQVEVVRDITFSVRVEGHFDASYRVGDNAAILPSDTLRRHVLQVGAANRERSPEEITALAAAQIHAANPAFTRVVVEAREQAWTRVGDSGFLAGMPSLPRLVDPPSLASPPGLPGRFAACRWGESGREELLGGVDSMAVLVTGGSGFTGFHRDALTVQGEAEDRPLCATLTARWSFAPGQLPSREASASIPAHLAAALADRPSNAIQQLVTAAGSDLLARTPALSSVWIELAAFPLSPLDAQLDPAEDGVRAHEASAGPLGVTVARVLRA